MYIYNITKTLEFLHGCDIWTLTENDEGGENIEIIGK